MPALTRAASTGSGHHTTLALCQSSPALLDHAARSTAPGRAGHASPRRRRAQVAEHAFLLGEQPPSPRRPPLLHKRSPATTVRSGASLRSSARARRAWPCRRAGRTSAHRLRSPLAIHPSLAPVAMAVPTMPACQFCSLVLVEPPEPPAPATLVCAHPPRGLAGAARLLFALARARACLAATVCLPVPRGLEGCRTCPHRHMCSVFFFFGLLRPACILSLYCIMRSWDSRRAEKVSEGGRDKEREKKDYLM